MEKRYIKVMFTKNGQGFNNYRISLPTTWINDFNLTEDNRHVYLYKMSNKIVISKEELKMNMELALAEVIKECDKEIKDGFICDSDRTDRFVDNEVEKAIISLSTEDTEEENLDEYFDELLEKVHDYLDENYKMVSDNENGNFRGYWYDSNKFNFRDIDELENYFKIDRYW